MPPRTSQKKSSLAGRWLSHGVARDWRFLFRWVAGIALITGSLFVPGRLQAQEKPSDKSMAAYADAANYQTGGAIELAIDAWRKFLSDYPKHPMAPEAAHYLGVCYMQKENPDYVAASKAFDRALKDSDYELREESLANHGWCLYASSGEADQRDVPKLRRALETFRSLRKEFPKSEFLDRALFYSGEASFGMGQPKQAIEFYNQLLAMPDAKDSPLRCDALYARGVAHEESDQFEKAMATYKQLLSSCERVELVTDVHLRLGDLMILRNDFDAAVASFERAIASTDSPEDRSYALFRQAFALVQSDRPADAAAKYDKLLADYPNSPHAAQAVLASAQSTYRSGDIDEAAKRFRKVLGQNDPVAATEAAHWLARIKITKGQPAEAIEMVRTQLQRGTEGEFATDLQLDLAEALSMDPSTVEESLELFEQAYRDSPSDQLAPRALYNAAFSALQINQPKRALDLANEFIRRFPNDTLLPDVQFIAAEGHLLTGQAERASDTYQRLLSTTERDNIQRPLWVLRAAEANIASSRFDETVAMLASELETLQVPSQRAEAFLLLGNAHLRSGRHEQAAKSFESSVQADPDWARSDEASLMAGQARLAAGDKSDAASTWRQLIRSEPKSRMADQARYKLAQLASNEGNYETASKLYQQVLQSNQDPGLVPYALYANGWVLMQSGKYRDAYNSLDKMLRENKQHPLRNEATLARGITLRNLGQLERARADLQLFLAIPPTGDKLGHALYELALIDQTEKQPDEAVKKLEQLVASVPDYPAMDKVLHELGWSSQESGDERAAVKYFSRLVEEYPQSPLVDEASYFVGQKHYADQRWRDAASQFRLTVDATDDEDLSEKAYYRLGWSLLKMDDFRAAEKAFAEMAEQHPNGPLAFDARTMVAECRFKRGDFQAALEGYTLARNQIRQSDDTSKSVRDAADRQVRELVFLHGGQSATQEQQWKEAIGWFDELRERFPTSKYLPQVFYETGYAYQQQGDRTKALKFFAEVAENYRNEVAARARFMMGEIHFANRDFDKAIPEFQRVMFGFGADKAPPRIKNWQAKSGFEAGRCSELLMQLAKTSSSQEKARKYATDFFSYVIQQHPQHELAAKSRDRIEALTK